VTYVTYVVFVTYAMFVTYVVSVTCVAVSSPAGHLRQTSSSLELTSTCDVSTTQLISFYVSLLKATKTF